MFSAILILLLLPITDIGRSRGIQFRPLNKIAFYVFVANFLILMQLVAKHVESPFIEFGQISTVLYFSHFIGIILIASIMENTFVDLSLKIKGFTPHKLDIKRLLELSKINKRDGKQLKGR